MFPGTTPEKQPNSNCIESRYLTMYNDISKPPPPLPSPELTEVAPGISLLLPLSRRGHGPGLIILTADRPEPLAIKEGVPSPLIKWAEEGYTVVEIQAQALGVGKRHVLESAVEALSKCGKCEPKDKIGLVGKSLSCWAFLFLGSMYAHHHYPQRTILICGIKQHQP